MEIKTEISNYYDLKSQLWGSNVEYELKQVEEWGMEEDFFTHIESIFSDDIYDITSINDYIAYEFSAMKWIRETKTLDDIDSLEELKEYAEDEEKAVIDTAIENNYDEYLWEYMQDNYAGETLQTVLDEISSLEPNDYIYFDNINNLSEFISHVNNNESVMEVIDAIKKANLTDEYWNRLEEECKGVGMTLTNVVADIESLDIDELIESL